MTFKAKIISLFAQENYGISSLSWDISTGVSNSMVEKLEHVKDFVF